MANIKLVVAYDGTDFHGFARQGGLRTVQGTLEAVVQRLVGHPVEIYGSGRTDAGVHARAQVVNWEQDVGPPAERYTYVLRRCLPTDIIALEATAVDEAFHAQYSAIGKTYRYRVDTRRIPDIFGYRFAEHAPYTIDVPRMDEAARVLLGRHDFTSFCATSSQTQSKERTVHEIHILPWAGYLDFFITGSGFLQHMVRIIVGTLLEVGRGRIEPGTVERILYERDRKLAGPTAAARGLSLWDVYYEETDLKLAISNRMSYHED
jgi:tRNA pseudouridine38-40 synthase